MDQEFLNRLSAYIDRSKRAGEKLEAMSEDFEWCDKRYAFSLRHVSPSARIRLGEIVQHSNRIREFGEQVWQLERAIDAVPRLRAGHGVHVRISYRDTERRWELLFVDSVLQEDGVTHETRELHRVEGENLPTALGRAIAAVPMLARPGYT